MASWQSHFSRFYSHFSALQLFLSALMTGLTFTFLTTFVAFLGLSAARCRFSKEKLPGKIEKYNKCLSIGFDPSLEGCVRVAREDQKLRRKEERKCKELEKYLLKCGHTCKQEQILAVRGDDEGQYYSNSNLSRIETRVSMLVM